MVSQVYYDAFLEWYYDTTGLVSSNRASFLTFDGCESKSGLPCNDVCSDENFVEYSFKHPHQLAKSTEEGF